LRAGRVRVAGVATVEAHEALRSLQRERGLPTLSQALGVALEEWRRVRCHGVENPPSAAGTSESRSDQGPVLHPVPMRERGSSESDPK
jgi:hypothetical protein